MKLKLTRSQESGGLTGKVTFRLHAIVVLDEKESSAVKRYKLGKEIVYSKQKIDPTAAKSFAGAIGRLAAAATFNIKLTVNDMVEGRTIECKEITEMLAVEEHVREACEILNSILQAAAYFGGEEVVEF